MVVETVFKMTSEHAILHGSFLVVSDGFFVLIPSGKRVANIQWWEIKNYSIPRMTVVWCLYGICRAQALGSVFVNQTNAHVRPHWALSLLGRIGVLCLAPGDNMQEPYCILCQIWKEAAESLSTYIIRTFQKHNELQTSAINWDVNLRICDMNRRTWVNKVRKTL